MLALASQRRGPCLFQGKSNANKKINMNVQVLLFYRHLSGELSRALVWDHGGVSSGLECLSRHERLMGHHYFCVDGSFVHR